MSRSDTVAAIGANATQGERLKQQVLQFVEACRETIVLRARRALLTHVLRFGTVTADDVQELVALPPGIDPRVFGAVPIPLARAGAIRFAGYVRTTRRKAHARDIKRWELNDRHAAERWLAEHPDVDDGSSVTRREV